LRTDMRTPPRRKKSSSSRVYLVEPEPFTWLTATLTEERVQ